MNESLIRPPRLFDRETEWADLAGFFDARPGVPRLGLVYGRRRQGKSFMLESLVDAAGGFYYQALEETRSPALERFAAALASFAGLPEWAAGRVPDWQAAIRAVVEQAAGRPIVIDEFPYLLRESPELPSAIQAVYDGARSGRFPSFRLVLCGSALSVMSQLLTGSKALRGRAMLDMPVRSFDFREARAFWGIADPEIAFLVHAVVGGRAGYRDLLGGATPPSVDKLGDWLAAGVLNPSHALFREAEYLLSEDPSLVDRALYRSIIAAIALGEATRRGVANTLGRPETALDHSLNQLERGQFIIRDADLLRPNRPLLRVADPLLRFHFAIQRPDLARFELRQTRAAWTAAEPRFRSNVLGPHFEALAREWTRRYAARRTLGGRPRAVGFVQVNDPQVKQAYELDVVAMAEEKEGGAPAILAIGEAKSSDRPRGLGDLGRLVRLRSLLARRADVTRTRLLLFGRSGFQPELIEAALRLPDVELVDLARLYDGD
jgi:hypothetical protein